MLKSMTGYGRGIAGQAGLQLTIEMRTVNHRFAEVNVRVAKEWIRLEESVKKYVLSHITRGRVDVILTISQSDVANQVVRVNEPLALQGYHALLRLASTLNQRTDALLEQVLGIPGVIVVDDAEYDEQIIDTLVMGALGQACESVLRMRSQEGEMLVQDVGQRLEDFSQLLGQIEAFAPEVLHVYRERLTQRLQDTVGLDRFDEQRLLTEVVVYTDRTDIQEELVRLRSHIGQFETYLQATEAVGRKLDFLIQEMNREVNTIGSKANHAGIAVLVVECKSKLEQMREQIQNIE